MGETEKMEGVMGPKVVQNLQSTRSLVLGSMLCLLGLSDRVSTPVALLSGGHVPKALGGPAHEIPQVFPSPTSL